MCYQNRIHEIQTNFGGYRGAQRATLANVSKEPPWGNRLKLFVDATKADKTSTKKSREVGITNRIMGKQRLPSTIL